MLKTETLRARVEPHLKDEVDKIFKQLGLTTSQAIILFCQQVVVNRGLPFEVKIPNALTQEAMTDVLLERDLKKVSLTKMKADF